MSRALIDYDNNEGVFTFNKDGETLGVVPANEVRVADDPQQFMQDWVYHCCNILTFRNMMAGAKEGEQHVWVRQDDRTV